MTRFTVFALVILVTSPGVAQEQDPQVRLWDAAIAGDTSGVRAAFGAGAQIDSLDVRVSRNGRLALNWAAWHNHPPVITLLLALGADVNAVNLTGFTALHHAAENGSLEAARALLLAGADFTMTTGGGLTAEAVATAREHPAVAHLLAEARAGRMPR
jgi:ankyrin repeat protein